jgi:hypothetical protein
VAALALAEREASGEVFPRFARQLRERAATVRLSLALGVRFTLDACVPQRDANDIDAAVPHSRRPFEMALLRTPRASARLSHRWCDDYRREDIERTLAPSPMDVARRPQVSAASRSSARQRRGQKPFWPQREVARGRRHGLRLHVDVGLVALGDHSRLGWD